MEAMWFYRKSIQARFLFSPVAGDGRVPGLLEVPLGHKELMRNSNRVYNLKKPIGRSTYGCLHRLKVSYTSIIFSCSTT